MNSYTTSWLNFIGALHDVYGVPLVFLALEVKLKEGLEESPEEDTNENLMNDEDVPSR